MTQDTPRQVWIGLAEVRQRPGARVLMDRNEAVVNALATADNEDAFRETVRLALDALGFDLIAIEEAEPLVTRCAQFEVDADLLALAEAVRHDAVTRFGPFHTWVSDSESETGS